jgi:predicted CXXCH cytochrome family protein
MATAPRAHAPVKAGACFECHTPHAAAASRPHLVARGGPDLCFRCHGAERALLLSGRPHAPFLRGQCTACHAPHGSGKKGMLVAEGDALCTTCHDPKAARLVELHGGSPPEGCASCHEAHGQ